MVPPAAAITSRPTAELPVKLTMSIRGSVVSSLLASMPLGVTALTTPGGISVCSSMIRARARPAKDSPAPVANPGLIRRCSIRHSTEHHAANPALISKALELIKTYLPPELLQKIVAALPAIAKYVTPEAKQGA